MVERELPIQRLMASGTCWRAIRAQGISLSTCENNVTYSLRRLSFSNMNSFSLPVTYEKDSQRASRFVDSRV